jgi:hypothetical protein
MYSYIGEEGSQGRYKDERKNLLSDQGWNRYSLELVERLGFVNSKSQLRLPSTTKRRQEKNWTGDC